jgi:hypothetical protein
LPQEQIVRARVTNTGKRGTKNVRAQITHVWLKPNPLNHAGGKEWVGLVDMPVWLTWASRAHDSDTDAERIDLARGMLDYIAISAKSQSDDLDYMGHWLMERGEQCRDDRLLAQMNRIGEYRIEITAFSDQTEPVTAVVAYKQSAINKQLVDLQRSSAPIIPLSAPPGDLKDVFKGSEPT